MPMQDKTPKDPGEILGATLGTPLGKRRPDKLEVWEEHDERKVSIAVRIKPSSYFHDSNDTSILVSFDMNRD